LSAAKGREGPGVVTGDKNEEGGRIWPQKALFPGVGGRRRGNYYLELRHAWGKRGENLEL